MGNLEMHKKWLCTARNKAPNFSIYVIENGKHN